MHLQVKRVVIDIAHALHLVFTSYVLNEIDTTSHYMLRHYGMVQSTCQLLEHDISQFTDLHSWGEVTKCRCLVWQNPSALTVSHYSTSLFCRIPSSLPPPPWHLDIVYDSSPKDVGTVISQHLVCSQRHVPVFWRLHISGSLLRLVVVWLGYDGLRWKIREQSSRGQDRDQQTSMLHLHTKKNVFL